MTSETQPNGSVTSQYDAAGDRTRLTWADGFYVTYTYDTIGSVIAIGENGATSGVSLLASYTYDNLGRRTLVTYGNGTTRAYAYDAVSRLAGLQLTFPNATNYNELIGGVGGFGTPIGYTPSSQIATITRSTDSFAWTGGYNVSRTYTTNGLNQYTNSGVALGYDPKGNLTSSGSSAYSHNYRNLLTTATGLVGSISYDNMDRLSSYSTSSATTLPYYDGSAVVAETSGNAVANRYVLGPGADEPIVWYQGSGTGSRNFLATDERGSIIAVSNSLGTVVNVNTYDEFGIPASTNAAYLPRYGYTGQTWYPDVGLYNYKARFYSPTLGRFMQADPIGYGDGLNMYNYVGSDPVNLSDPSGLAGVAPPTTEPPIIVTGCAHGYTLTNEKPNIFDGPKPCTIYYDSPNGPSGTGYVFGNFPYPAPPQSKTPANPCTSAGRAPPPSAYANLGQQVQDRASDFTTDSFGGQLLNLGNLASFHRGGSMDAQVRYGGSPAYANYVFGVYLAASRASLQTALSEAIAYGAVFSNYPAGTPMGGPNYPSIPQTNVVNITHGYNDQANGTVCQK